MPKACPYGSMILDFATSSYKSEDYGDMRSVVEGLLVVGGDVAVLLLLEDF